MEKISFYITDKGKLQFLYELLKKLDFVIIPETKSNKQRKGYDFFKSAGIWKGRNITQEELRAKAWKTNY